MKTTMLWTENTPFTAGTLAFPFQITDAMNACALRFLGYEYEKSFLRNQNTDTKESLVELATSIVESLVLYDDQNKNMAAFFALQRGLFKGGGEYLTKYSDEHLAFDFLFLHLYRIEVPLQYAHKEYVDQWKCDFEGSAERIASYVRSSLGRIGKGKKHALEK